MTEYVTPQTVADWLASDAAPSAIEVAAVLKVGGTNDISGDVAQAKDVLAEVLTQAYRNIPVSVVTALVIEVSGEFIKRRSNPGGQAQGVQFAAGQPIRAARDPLAYSLPTLRRYVGMGLS